MVGKYQAILAGRRRLRVVNFRLSLPLSAGQFSISTTNRSLKDIWAAYRKKEVHVEVTIATDIKQPLPQQQIISREEQQQPVPEISKTSCEIEQIGDTLVKVEFIEYVGKRKKKVTRIEVKHSDLGQMIKDAGSGVGVQFALF